ncbi:hypothetical protein KOR34_29660 [Posidoniimonas corsicana]|uniref:Uncharacterized protein n=1 Tax=Posidoniimonas corsicana TaxID=1938618 RepID=A0A5C5VJD4_9BACT|nr:hypothetical protein [Posidoniimonas corsicana]TWT37999.1 hypothetical protein KOR34_29660 [Posidoniimonas corsicana]
MLDAARIAFLVVHLLTNSMAGGAPLAAAVLPLSSDVRRRLAGIGLLALLLGLLAGGLSTLLVLAGAWPAYESAAARLPSRAYLMLGGEWAFSAILMLVYWMSWSRLAGRRVLHGLIGVVASTNLLYHFPTMMVVLRLLAEDPGLAGPAVVSRDVFLDVLWRPLPLGLTAHFWGLSALLAGLVVRRLALAGEGIPRDARVGALVALVGAVGLFLSGVWCLLSAEGLTARSLLSMDSLSGLLFAGGVACALWLLARLMAEACTRRVAGDGPLTGAVLAALLMTAAARML